MNIYIRIGQSICPLIRPRNNNTEAVLSTPSCHILVSKYHSVKQNKPRTPWRNRDSRAGSGKVQYIPGHLVIESKEVLIK